MSQYKKDMIASFFFLILGALVLISVPLTIQIRACPSWARAYSPILSGPAW